MSASRRLVFRVEYDGTAYHGWQRQPGFPTVEETLLRALEELLGPTELQGASRTDAGVHARDQLATAAFTHPIVPHGFVKAINRRLPPDIAIRDAVEVDPDFEILGVRAAKTYAYRMYFGTAPRPLYERYAWRVRWALDLAALERAGAHLVGTHDFTSFAAANHGRSTTVRTVYSVRTTTESDQWIWQITGSGFLKQMVRNIVGTLVDVGRGHRRPDTIPEILAARARSVAGPTAPACGLTLERVWWTPEAGHWPIDQTWTPGRAGSRS